MSIGIVANHRGVALQMQRVDLHHREEVKKMSDKWELYKDAENKWRWRRTAPNGNVVGASSESYANKADCAENARRNGWKE